MVPKVTAIKLHKKSQLLELAFADGLQSKLSAEFLRVHSPSAEVQGHGKPVLVEQKQDVQIESVQPVGHYAVKIIFNDGHSTGIYTWSWLHKLASQHAQLWENYQSQIKAKAALEIPVRVKF